jgi:ribosomal-protein-alanine acetyltransferase
MIRRAEEKDLDALAKLAVDGGLHSFDRRSLRVELAKPHALVLAAEDDGVLAGVLVASCVAGESELLAIAVDPRARRRGLGRALLYEALAFARACGAETMHLEVRQDNNAARAFYSVEGFENVGHRRAYYGDGVDAVVMRRIIR